MYFSVISVEPTLDFKLILIFSNQEVRIFDMKPHLDLGVFKELKDLTKFNTVKISFDTIAWENDADLDPEFLYQESVLLANLARPTVQV